MTDERREELAALAALDFLDEAELRELRNADAQSLVREFGEIWSRLALDAPAVPPPAGLKSTIMNRLPARGPDAKVIAFSQWIPYAIAACLMVLGILQATQIIGLKSQLRSLQANLASENTEVAQLRENSLKGLRVADLPEAPAAQTNPTYAAAHVLVAWSPAQHCGTVATEALPAAPPDRDYQLWVLDPTAPGPISAGLVSGSREFEAPPINTSSPGFAISLEPRGGLPAPTGPILFAVAPGR